jgi:hypothetical protein
MLNTYLMFGAVMLLMFGIGLRFGHWVASRQIEPEYEKLLENNGELRSNLRHNKARSEISYREIKEKYGLKVRKLKSKLKKAKKR